MRPEAERAAFPLNRLSAPLGEHNAVLRARARTHYVSEFPGPLSIKTVTSGAAGWKCGRRRLVVSPGAFLVLNDGEPYTLEIDSAAPVSTFCIFFERGFVESVRAGMAQADAEPSFERAPFSLGLQPGEQRILPRLSSMGAACFADRLRLDEQALALSSDLLMLDEGFRRRINLMSARRASTREEIVRRVRRGQEFLHEHACEEMGLTGLSRAACLSPYHFHRSFRQIFGETPHQYRTRLRLAAARSLLETKDLTVTEACAAAGFGSAASFSLLFRSYYGVSPSRISKIR